MFKILRWNEVHFFNGRNAVAFSYTRCKFKIKNRPVLTLDDSTKETIRFRTEIIKLLVSIIVVAAGGLISSYYLCEPCEVCSGERSRVDGGRNPVVLALAIIFIFACAGTAIVQGLIISKLIKQ